MAREKIIVGVDLGTAKTQVLVCRVCLPSRKNPQILIQFLGQGQAPASGLRKGLIIDQAAAINSLKQALIEARQSSGISFDHGYFSFDGSHILPHFSRGVIGISRADGEVTEEDLNRVLTASQTISLSPNRKILHNIPRFFKIDEENGIKDPLGLKGVRLEADTLLISVFDLAIKNLNQVAEALDFGIDEIVFSPLAISLAVLSRNQKELGVLLLDIGGEISNLAVFEEGSLIQAAVLPIGANHISHDIAISFKIDLETADWLKKSYGQVLSETINKKEIIRFSEFRPQEKGEIPKKELSEIVEARLSDIFEWTLKELKKIDRIGLLPAGVVLVGGGSQVPGIVELTKRELKLPCQLGLIEGIEGIDSERQRDLATAAGLILWGSHRLKGEDFLPFNLARKSGFSRVLKFFRAFLP